MKLDDLANSVVKKLSDKNLQIATAESCTEGMVAQYITSVSGSSNVFSCGIISYANSVKESELNVTHEALESFGAVSRQVAQEMANGVRKKANADIGVSTTGIAGPTGGTAQKPVGTVYICVATKDETHVQKLSLLDECGNDRDKIRKKTVEKLFELVLSTALR